MIPISTTAQRLKVLGCPYKKQGASLVADEKWAAANLVRVTLPRPLLLSWDTSVTVHSVLVHRRIAVQLRGVFDALIAAGYWGQLLTYGGSYNVRKMRQSATPSAHCWGVALDFNTAQMPQGSKARWPKAFLAIWERYGFINGADFSKPDPMHFQCVEVIA